MLATANAAAFPQPATAYDFSKLRREKLGRGVVAFRSGEREAVVSWRYRMEDLATMDNVCKIWLPESGKKR